MILRIDSRQLMTLKTPFVNSGFRQALSMARSAGTFGKKSRPHLWVYRKQHDRYAFELTLSHNPALGRKMVTF
jgi:hypothetical protein